MTGGASGDSSRLDRVRCRGCGALVPDLEGTGPPGHEYLDASPGCWALYGDVLGREYSDVRYRAHGRSTVDIYAVQHPGVQGRKSSQSVWIHLVGLHLVIERAMPVDRAIAAQQRLASSRPAWEWLDPPPSLGALTVADVRSATDIEAHVAEVSSWADAAWNAWRGHHDAVRRLARDAADWTWSGRK
jgi:hypothetical protein